MIERSTASRRAADGIGGGLFLLAVQVEGAAAAAALRERLAERGIEPEGATDFTQYFRDPEGNRFAVSNYPLGVD